MSLTIDYVKSKSASRLVGLHSVVAMATIALIERSFARGVPILITQGLRTIAEQDALYAQGRTKPGSIVTNAKGGTSYHNFGVAIDFCLLLPDGKNVSWTVNKDWMIVVEEATKLGFEWGGDFKSIKDYPHFQMTFGLAVTQFRNGTKPTETSIAKLIAQIDRYMKGCDEVTRAEFEALTERVEKLEQRVPAPVWFIKEFGSGNLNGLISDPNFTLEGWRTLAVSLRAKK